MTSSKAKMTAGQPAAPDAVKETTPHARLSAALRDNLKRRKAQQRARAQGPAGTSGQGGPADGDQGA